MLNFIVVWRKEGNITPSNVIRAATAQLAFEAFKASNPGGGIPGGAPRFRVEGDITYVENAGGKVLANVIPIGG
jgi:hypothetical protein